MSDPVVTHEIVEVVDVGELARKTDEASGEVTDALGCDGARAGSGVDGDNGVVVDGGHGCLSVMDAESEGGDRSFGLGPHVVGDVGLTPLGEVHLL